MKKNQTFWLETKAQASQIEIITAGYRLFRPGFADLKLPQCATSKLITTCLSDGYDEKIRFGLQLVFRDLPGSRYPVQVGIVYKFNTLACINPCFGEFCFNPLSKAAKVADFIPLSHGTSLVNGLQCGLLLAHRKIIMKKILLSILAIVLIFEEWLWDLLTAFGHLLIRNLNLQKLEEWLSQSSPGVALMAFSIPLIIVAPINIIVFALLANGLILQGVLLELFAKLLGTLLIARVFALTKPQLLSFGLLNCVYVTITGWLDWAHQQITETTIYRLSMRFKAEAKNRFSVWLNKFSN